MADPLLASIRFALYADLMLAIGLAAFLLYGLGSGERADPDVAGPIRRSLLLLSLLGLPLSFAWLLALAAEMFGVAIPSLDTSMLAAIVLETSVGTAWLVQVASLAVSTIAAVVLVRHPTLTAAIITATGSVALGALAWSGHAAVSEEWFGLLNRASDIVHMIAASLWLGAIAAFLFLIRTSHPEARRVAARELSRFSLVGTTLVAVIAATGLMNLSMIAQIGNPLRWPPGVYGSLLFIKLGLFTVMLALAAFNRWKFAPQAQNMSGDARALRCNLAVEFAFGIAILLLVAILGLLEP